MNEKGFTLVELMAVIVLISIIALIGVTSVIGIRRQMDTKLFEEKLTSAIASAEKWGDDNKDELNIFNVSPKKILTLGELVANGYYRSEEGVNPTTYNYDNCAKKGSIYGYVDGELCKDVVTNNVDNVIVNEIEIYVYIKNNRVYACIEKNDNNKSFIKDFDKYSEKIYCGG